MWYQYNIPYPPRVRQHTYRAIKLGLYPLGILQTKVLGAYLHMLSFITWGWRVGQPLLFSESAMLHRILNEGLQNVHVSAYLGGSYGSTFMHEMMHCILFNRLLMNLYAIQSPGQKYSLFRIFASCHF